MPSAVTQRDGSRVLSLDGFSTRAGIGPYIPSADNEPERDTYGAAVTGISLAANPSDILMIQGSASKIIRVKSLVLNGNSATTGGYPALIVRRSTANTGGTSVVLGGFQHDTIDPAASAVVRYYTANPTALGTVVGNLHGGRFVASQANNLDRLILQYSWQNDKAIVLRGVSDFLCVNLGGAALAAATTVDIDLLWTEEANV